MLRNQDNLHPPKLVSKFEPPKKSYGQNLERMFEKKCPFQPLHKLCP